MDIMECTYCMSRINDDTYEKKQEVVLKPKSSSSKNENYLHCQQCQRDVHIKCLKRASTPGDLFGDVFFDFVCYKCVQLNYDNSPSTLKMANADSAKAIREKFTRLRMPWLLVIVLTLYNLSIKSKGLSRHHGYFHWRTHIVSFIDKNWNYLFEHGVKKRKNWIGSVSGTLSHNSPRFFTSGQELFKENGWWKLTYANKSPKDIYKLYEEICRNRQLDRMDKRRFDNNCSRTGSNERDNKRLKPCESDEDSILVESCSRTIPYMGRKPKKVLKNLNVLDDEVVSKVSQNSLDSSTTLEETMPLNTVQSNLMDFLAENFADDNLNMFNALPNIAPEPLVETEIKSDILPLLDTDNDDPNLYSDNALIKSEPVDLNGHLYSDFYSHLRAEPKLDNIYNPQQIAEVQQQHLLDGLNTGDGTRSGDFFTTNSEYSYDDAEEESTNTASIKAVPFAKDDIEPRPDSEEEGGNSTGSDTDDEAYKPRILQVTNFQQATTEDLNSSKIKEEPKIVELPMKKKAEIIEENAEQNEPMAACKPSLFTKNPRRNWPWLLDQAKEESEEILTESAGHSEREHSQLVPMSEYEESEVLRKLRKIFALEEKCQLRIPCFIRRYYRKLCIREWKREHGKPLFNLDDYLGNTKTNRDQEEKSKIIDRYQLISLSSTDARKSFYARIAGSSQNELFESPYTQRILHPFVYRDKKCFPPFLKLMCELKFKVNGIPPTRAPVDYCYVRPNHIAAVNALLQTMFWPGIDMSECLSYPDFSVVALYRKLIIGCGFLVPDVGFNEAYISFMAVRPGWQRSGVATFMLYHLIQTCMTKDITLHVSATNPAVVLYQKFGFKIEEIILDFYEKYLPMNSKHSRNAFFLRLMR
uniref:N-acetyltransferase domain-containing protein n=1 Tax=Glossina austeni TaxID=7395 RepID=A0A1A9UMT0_GLOAU